MPTLNTPTLTLGTTDNNKRDATVAGSITFDAGDVGKTFRLEIKLYGEDKSGDNLPSGDAVGDDLLYTYKFGSSFFQLPYKTLTVGAAGSVNFSEKRSVAAGTLDEDPGQKVVGWADINTPILMPRQDEVYASVTISGAPVTKKSATVVAGIGV